jgi:hypothetical protein
MHQTARHHPERSGTLSGDRWRLLLRSFIEATTRKNIRSFPVYRPERHYMRGPGPKCRAKSATRDNRDQGVGAVNA